MDIIRQQSTALWNIVIIVCLPLLGMIGNELVVYLYSDSIGVSMLQSMVLGMLALCSDEWYRMSAKCHLAVTNVSSHNRQL